MGCVKRLAVLTALLLTGCSTALPVFNEYSAAQRFTTPVSIPHTNMTAVIVRFNPHDPLRAMVVSSRMFTNNIGPTEWVARLDEFRAAYAGALDTQLLAQQRHCSVASSRAFADILMIDFTLTCKDQQ